MKGMDMKRLFGKPAVTIKSVSVGGGDSMEEDDERLMAAKAVIRAIKDNDPEALDMALSDHYEACSSTDSKEEEDSEE